MTLSLCGIKSKQTPYKTGLLTDTLLETNTFPWSNLSTFINAIMISDMLQANYVFAKKFKYLTSLVQYEIIRYT